MENGLRSAFIHHPWTLIASHNIRNPTIYSSVIWAQSNNLYNSRPNIDFRNWIWLWFPFRLCVCECFFVSLFVWWTVLLQTYLCHAMLPIQYKAQIVCYTAHVQINIILPSTDSGTSGATASCWSTGRSGEHSWHTPSTLCRLFLFRSGCMVELGIHAISYNWSHSSHQ